MRRVLIRALGIAVVIGLVVYTVAGQLVTANLRGRVSDERGSRIIDATVIAIERNGTARPATTTEEGSYSFTGLPPGKYILRATAPGFDLYQNPEVVLVAGQTEYLDITLKIAPVRQTVVVPLDNLPHDPHSNPGCIIFRGEQLDALPDDLDLLVAALQALAGTAAGPDGGEIIVDGFAGARKPPKGSIREVRINQNPFSAEFDRPGFGRVEILTKAGASKFSGNTVFNFNNEKLNSRNPFASNRAPFQIGFTAVL